MEILIEKLFDNTGEVKPLKRIESKKNDDIEVLLKERCEFLPEGAYFASQVEKNGTFKSYLATIIITNDFTITKNDYDADMLASLHSKK